MAVQDAINGYRLFLGRDPDSERVAEERGAVPLFDSVGGFIASPEFAERILDPLVNGYPVPQTRLAALPPADLIEWAAAELPLADTTRQKLRQAKSWRQLLVHILLDELFFSRIGLPFDHASASAMRRRYLAAWSSGQVREIAGAIDDASAFEIRGWAANLFDTAESLQLEVLLDNFFLGSVECSGLRADIKERIGGTGLFGFSFIVPAVHERALETQRFLVVRDAISKAPIARPMQFGADHARTLDSVLRIRDEIHRLGRSLASIEASLPEIMTKLSYPLSMYHPYQEEVRRSILDARRNIQAASDALETRPGITIVIPDGGGGAQGLLDSVRSLQSQAYGHWECVIETIDAGAPTERSALIDKIVAGESRIRAAKPRGQSQDRSWDQLFSSGAGVYCMMLRQGDVLTANALFEVARCLQGEPPDIVYFDEDAVSLDRFGRHRFRDPRLKPDFDYDLLLGAGYIGENFVFRREALDRAGGFAQDTGEAAFLDLLLRMIEKGNPRGVAHATGVLCHHVEREVDTGPEKPAPSRILACINAHLERTSPGSLAVPHEDPVGRALADCRRIRWHLPDPAPSVSIVIPTRDSAGLLRQCLLSVVDSLREYPGQTEIIVVDHESREQDTHDLLQDFKAWHGIRIVPFIGRFNWAAINNSAAQSATGDVLVFLNNDTMVLSRDWLREFASQLARPSVGVVGARLLYEDGTVQHGGVVLGVYGGAIHEGVGQSVEDGGYMGRTALQRNTLAVTGACMATRSALFRELGGFDESSLGVEFNDTDYCLRVHDRGLSVIYTPFATLYHFESKSRGFTKTAEQERRNYGERCFVSLHWRHHLEQDPYYNSLFERFSRPFSRLRHPELPRKPLLDSALDDDAVPWH